MSRRVLYPGSVISQPLTRMQAAYNSGLLKDEEGMSFAIRQNRIGTEEEPEIDFSRRDSRHPRHVLDSSVGRPARETFSAVINDTLNDLLRDRILGIAIVW